MEFDPLRVIIDGNTQHATPERFHSSGSPRTSSMSIIAHRRFGSGDSFSSPIGSKIDRKHYTPDTFAAASVCRHVGIHLPRLCSTATVSGKGEDPTTRRVRRRHRSALKVCMVPMGREGIPPIENATPMNNGGGIGTHLATTTNVDRRHHRPRRGDHMKGRRSRIGTGSDSTVREIETETCVIGIGIRTWADWHRRPRQQEGIGTNAIDGLGSHSRNHRDWTQRV